MAKSVGKNSGLGPQSLGTNQVFPLYPYIGCLGYPLIPSPGLGSVGVVDYEDPLVTHEEELLLGVEAGA